MLQLTSYRSALAAGALALVGVAQAQITGTFVVETPSLTVNTSVVTQTTASQWNLHDNGLSVDVLGWWSNSLGAGLTYANHTLVFDDNDFHQKKLAVSDQSNELGAGIVFDADQEIRNTARDIGLIEVTDLKAPIGDKITSLTLDITSLDATAPTGEGFYVFGSTSTAPHSLVPLATGNNPPGAFEQYPVISGSELAEYSNFWITSKKDESHISSVRLGNGMSMTATPEPITTALLACGAVAFLRKRKRA